MKMTKEKFKTLNRIFFNKNYPPKTGTETRPKSIIQGYVSDIKTRMIRTITMSVE